MGNFSPMQFGQLYVADQTIFNTTLSAANIVAGAGGAAGSLEVEMFLPPTSAREVHERTAVRSGYHTLPPISGSPYGGTFSIRFPMHGFSATTPTTNPTNHAEALFLKAILGSSNSKNYKAAGVDGSDAGTTTVVNLDGTNPGDFEVGTGILFADDTNNDQMNLGFGTDWADGTPDTLTMLVPLSGLAETGSAALGTNTIYLSTAQPTPQSMLWRGLDNNTRLRIGGCIPTSCTISLNPKEPVMCEIGYICNEIIQDADSSSLIDQTYTKPILPVPTGNNAARMVYKSNTAAIDFDVASFEISIEASGAPQLGHGATTGVRDYVITNRIVTATFTSLLSGTSTGGTANPFDDTSGAGAPDGKPIVDLVTTTPAIQLQVGSTAGNIMGLVIPQATMISVPELVDQDGMIGATFTCQPGNYAGDGVAGGGGADPAANSDFRICFG